MKLSFWILLSGLILLNISWTKQKKNHYDIVIYGGTSAGVMAAVQAVRMDKDVIIVCPEKHPGGMTSNGLGWTDSGKKQVIGGLGREFYHRIWKYYNHEKAWKFQKKEVYGNRGQGGLAIDNESQTMWTFEPHVAELVFKDLIDEYNIPVRCNQWLDRKDGVKMKDNRIQSVTMLNGNTYYGKIFIDATYEGDLMAAAGVSYTTGRESNSQYYETLNGVQTKNAVYHQFKQPVDPYLTPGDSSSGLLPLIHKGEPGKENEGDNRIQAYCYRMCLSDLPENMIPFQKPDNYDPMQYELLLRAFNNNALRKEQFTTSPLPNRKTDSNNSGAFSTDYIGMNYEYPEASYEQRKEIRLKHKHYQQGLMYFLANDERLPIDFRENISRWGLAKDEFTDNNNWPWQIYVRESRRMIGETVITENHLRRIDTTLRSVGMGSYNMDSHNVQRYIDKNGFVKNEGDVEVNPGAPYPIDYGALIPKEQECSNLLVPVCVSATHIAYGSVRMEPVFMILGQSAATAASFAIDESIPVQKLEYQKLKKHLIKDKQVLYLGL